MISQVTTKFYRLYFIAAFSLPVISAQAAAVASAHRLATEAGAMTIQEGGNAFDAAVAVSAALAVVEPYSSGLGGGGFYLLYIASETRYVFVDAREKAPLQAHRDMYLDDQGEVKTGASIDGPLAAGIPGIVKALEHLSTRYGNKPLADSLRFAIRHAHDGFAVDRVYHRLARWRKDALRATTASRTLFLDNGEVPAEGYRIQQPDLARTLTAISERGAKAFYSGPLAQKMVASVRAHGGIWQMRDLQQYQIVERNPTIFEAAGATIVSAPPPSSGGTVIAQILQQLEALQALPSPPVNLLVEAMRRAYRDRALYLGDSDFVEVPIKRLMSKDYAAGLAAGINPLRATKSEWISAQPRESNHTTHFSIMDSHGNMVAATLSINYPFGSGFVAEGTGVLLNDEMDDFAARPNSPNAYGLIGGKANAIAPGKRMLSSMSPTIVHMADRDVILGTPGGSRIITMVLQGILSALQKRGAATMVNRARIHHQFLPDRIFFEPYALTRSEQQRLTEMGYVLEEGTPWGNMQAIIRYRSGRIEAASDRRGVGWSWTKDMPPPN